MTATLEQVPSDWARLIELARHGEEVVITDRGRVIAKLTGVPELSQPASRQAWLARLAQLRQRTATDKTTPTTEEILEELREERA